MKKSQKTPQKPNKKSKKQVLKKENKPADKAKPKSFDARKPNFFERYQKDAKEANLDIKREAIGAAVVSVVVITMGLLGTFYWKQPLLMAPAALFASAYVFMLLNRPKSILRKKVQEKQEEFVHLLSFFRLFINNGKPVYVALEETRTYARGEMVHYFDQLLSGIDGDKTIEPYLAFSNHFDSMEIKQTMISIYELSLDGGKERFLHFDSIFERIAEEKRNEAYERLKNRLANLNFLPLIGSVFSMGLVTIAVVILMGSSNYGF